MRVAGRDLLDPSPSDGPYRRNECGQFGPRRNRERFPGRNRQLAGPYGCTHNTCLPGAVHEYWIWHRVISGFSEIFLANQFNLFPLHRKATSNDWYVRPQKPALRAWGNEVNRLRVVRNKSSTIPRAFASGGRTERLHPPNVRIVGHSVRCAVQEYGQLLAFWSIATSGLSGIPGPQLLEVSPSRLQFGYRVCRILFFFCSINNRDIGG